MTSSAAAPPLFPLPRQGAGHAPARRPGSIRRTTSIDVDWPDGLGRDSMMAGRARDLATPFDGAAPAELARAGFTLIASPRREIVSLATEPPHPRAPDLVGVRAGGMSREKLVQAMGDARGTPLFQLLDDFAGASLVAGWIWTCWEPEWVAQLRAAGLAEGQKGPRPDICAGFAQGSSALRNYDEAGPAIMALSRNDVSALADPADPAGWHDMVEHGSAAPSMRRARRIDLWADGDAIRIDAGFQDSGIAPDGGRIAVHEYRVHAVVDAGDFVVRALQALPLILPHTECPAAAINASKMVGRPLADFRQSTLALLPGADGCTHLNDMLRALADVPALARRLPSRGGGEAHQRHAGAQPLA